MATHIQVLREKRGFTTVMTLGIMAIVVMFAMGMAIVNYATQSILVTQEQILASAVKSRADSYIGTLNASPTVTGSTVPSTSPVTDSRTTITTQITSTSDAADGLERTLVITAANPNGRYEITRSVKILKTPTTHISGFDSANHVIWTKSNEVNVFGIWSVDGGSIRALTNTEIQGAQKNPTTWAWSQDRMGIDSLGRLWAWGINDNGQTGTGQASGSWINTPEKVAGGIKWRSATHDGNSGFGIDTSGKLWAWGANDWGKLGIGNYNGQWTPVKVSSNLTFQAITTSHNSVFALDSTGHLWAWGANGGRLPIGTNDSQNVPRSSNISTTFTDITTSAGSMYAVDTGGRLWTWGNNSHGELGLGHTNYVDSPTQLSASIRFASISAAGNSAAGIDVDGHLWSWGAAGKVGDGSGSQRSLPVQISNSSFSSVSVGRYTAYAITSYGALHAWGSNANGEFGNGSTDSSYSPVAILPNVQFSNVYGNPGSKWTAAVDINGGQWSLGHSGNGMWYTTNTTSSLSAIKMPSPTGFVKQGW